MLASLEAVGPVFADDNVDVTNSSESIVIRTSGGFRLRRVLCVLCLHLPDGRQRTDSFQFHRINRLIN
jgi:hypothetical protein